MGAFSRARLRISASAWSKTHPAREFDEDLRLAGIPKHTDQGKLDFHACRVAYVSWVVEAGATVKEAQSLARHATPELTVNGYARARSERLAEVAERVGQNFRSIAGAQRENGGALIRAIRDSCVVEAAGIEPASKERGLGCIKRQPPSVPNDPP